MSRVFSLLKTSATNFFLLLVISMTGCANISLHKIASIETEGTSKFISHGTGKGYVQVYRAGKQVNTKKNMSLQVGDEIQTSPHGSAVIRFREYGTIVLDANTRVRIGSLEVIFGKIFADVRGLFSTYDEDVTLSVEGTRFMFEVNANRVSRAVVLEGVVRMSSNQNKWQPVQVSRGRQFDTTRLSGTGPLIESAKPAELREVSRKLKQIPDAPEYGFCCSNGVVNQSLSNQCQGKFYNNRNSATQGCKQGWCCQNKNVKSALKHQCYGKFYTNPKSAKAACLPSPSPEPMGWCCIGGYQLIESTQKACRGEFLRKDQKREIAKCTIY